MELCEKMKKAMLHYGLFVTNGGIYLPEDKDYSLYDREMWLVHYCPFCGKKLLEDKKVRNDDLQK